MNRTLSSVDSEVAGILEGELERQRSNLIMIPSENYASRAVLQTQGCIMTNKYAEGYPGARFYNGCEYMDLVETLAVERARKLFGAEHVNVQPHTGSQANMAAYYTLLEPGDTILAMNVAHGGHLTHGASQNFSGKYYKVFSYGVDKETGRLNYDEVSEIAGRCKPKLIVCGASAYPRVIDFEKFREIADKVGAYLLADIAHIVGLVAAKVHPNPVPYCDIVTSTTHKTLRGPRGAFIMSKKKWAGRIDRAVFPGIQAGPLMHIIAAKAVSFKEASSPGFKKYQEQIVKNARALASALLEEGFDLVSGGTDNHLMLVDLSGERISGREAADLLEEAGIVVNKNLIPFDKRPPQQASGIRPGTPAITTRGMREKEMEKIGKMMSRVLHNPEDSNARKEIREEVRKLCRQFPVYGNLNQR
jgi:glycine hydroxymethyltransferase